MALSFKTGSFNSKTSTGSQAVTGVGFQPKAVIFYSAWEITEDTVAAGCYWCYGFTDGTNQGVIANSADNSGGVSNGSRECYTNACISLPYANASTDYAKAAITSLDSDGFTINWSTSIGALARPIYYIALGGADITNIKVGTFNDPASTGNVGVTGVGFKPDCVLFAHALANANTRSVGAYSGLSFTDGTNHGSLALTDNASSTKVTRRYQRTSKCIVEITGTTLFGEATLTSLDSDGFTINYSTRGGTNPQLYLAIKGGKFKVGSFSSTTSTGSQAVTGVGFNPKGIMLASVDITSSTSINTDNRLTIGAADGTNSNTMGLNDRTAVSPGNCHSDSSSSHVFNGVTTTTLNAQATLTSLDTDGFTLNWGTNDGALGAMEIIYIAFSDALTRVTTSQTLKYALKKQIANVSTIKYALKKRVVDTSTIKYALKKRVPTLRTVKYALKARIAAPRTIKYAIKARIAKVETLKYALKHRFTTQRTTIYALKKRIPTQRTVKYALKTRLKGINTIKYNLRRRIYHGILAFYMPLYVYPDWYNGGSYHWQPLLTSAAAHPDTEIVVTLNVNSGPDTAQNSDYVHGISDLKTAKIKVLGYVFTSYGARAAATVKADIDSWYNFYPNLDGILLDEFANVAGSETYYADLRDYIHAKGGLRYVWGNPGAATTESYVATVDTLLIWENTAAPNTTDVQTRTFSTSNYAKDKFGVTARSVTQPITSYINTTLAPYVRYVFFSDIANYNSLPTYLDSEITAFAQRANARTVIYALKKRVPTLRTVKYAVKARVPTLRTIKYAVKARIVAPRTLKYKLTARLAKAETLKYALKKRIPTVRTIIYKLDIISLSRVTTVRTVKYALKSRVPAQRTLKYKLTARLAKVETIKYGLKKRVPTFPTLKYGLKKRIPSQRTTIYALRKKVSTLRTVKYGLKARIQTPRTIKYKLSLWIATNRTLKYVLRARVKTPSTIKYALLKRITPTLKTLKYALRLKVVTTRTIKYKLTARLKRVETLVYQLIVTGVLSRVYVTKTIQYKLTARLSKPQSLKYALKKSVLSSRVLKYSLKKRLASSRVFKYALVKRFQSSKILKYSLYKRVPSFRVLKYSLKQRIVTSKVLKYKLIARLKTPRTVKYRLLKRLPTLRTTKYQLRKSVQTQRTIEYGLVARLKSIQTIVYQVLVWGLSRVESRITLIYELYPTWWLMPRADKVVEQFIKNNYSDDKSVINPPKSAISWGKVWDQMGVTSRTVLKCIQMPTKLTQLDPPQKVRLESTPVLIKIVHRDQENSKAPLLQNMENYIINMLWNNVNSDQIKNTGVNHILPVSYNYVDVDIGVFELDIIVNVYFFRKIPA